MTLMDAQQYDEARSRRRRNFIVLGVILALVLAWVLYHERNYRERHGVSQFFDDLKNQNYEAAYGVWFRDPNWKQHQDKHSNYTYADFYRDWGPGGEWGLIKSYDVDCSLSTGSGVIVQATVNDRAEHPYLWVSNSDKTLSFSPTEVQCGNWFAWLTE
jgi:hypothetical protein